METIIVIIIVIAAAVYLVRRFMKQGPGTGCGFGCDSCGCAEKKNGNGSCAGTEKKRLTDICRRGHACVRCIRLRHIQRLKQTIGAHGAPWTENRWRPGKAVDTNKENRPRFK